MKAIVQTRRGLQLQHVDRPEPEAHEVLVRVVASSVTAGDVVLGKLPGVMFWSPVRKVLGVPPKKTTPGHEFAGVVEAVGRDVTRFSAGEAVFGTTTGLAVGANAEYVCVPEAWDTGVIAHKPEGMPFADAAALPVGV